MQNSVLFRIAISLTILSAFVSNMSSMAYIDYGGCDYGGCDYGGCDYGGCDYGGFYGGCDYGGCDYGGFYCECDYGGCEYGECDPNHNRYPYLP